MHKVNEMLEVTPVLGIPEIHPGDILSDILDKFTNGHLLKTDILVVTQKIVSKAEGRFMALDTIVPGSEANRLAGITGKDARLVELILAESDAVVRAAPNVLIVRHRLGFVMANAGIDQSNLGPAKRDHVLLLPEDPDQSAAKICAQLGCAVVISDSFGRPWRQGVVGVAIGAAGLPALLDLRGERDRAGRTLQTTQFALADCVASAAALVTGEAAEGVPAVILRGYRFDAPETTAAALIRPLDEDLFR